jgi:eukaryotic-like serine/threonine-protein kinase
VYRSIRGPAPIAVACPSSTSDNDPLPVPARDSLSPNPAAYSDRGGADSQRPVSYAAGPYNRHSPTLVTLSPGTRLGVYEIVAPIGSGGMGEVYRARDTKLNREVAVKVLPESLATDPERLARFSREAQVLAALNHPNIAHIHGFEDSTGVAALVMELVEGPTLADRLARGPMPLDEALPIAKQIAEGLEAAHEQGIVHRDLKPTNIKVRDDGTVKILDFGLAKAIEPKQPSGVNITQSPTITTPAMMTGVGVILGTAAYMSPEQAKGRPADKRSDVWAFGCTIYEMLTGTCAFGAENVGDILANVLRNEPDWTRLPASTPPAVLRLVRRCLRKDPLRRLQHMGDARLDLDEAFDPASITFVSPQRLRSRRVVAGTALLLCVALGLLVGMRTLGRVGPSRQLRLDVATPPTLDPLSFALSPDGLHIVYVVNAGDNSGLVVRALETGAIRVLPGTEDARAPFWSPDGRSIGFFAGGKLARVDVDNGTVRTLTNTINAYGGTWNNGGVVVFSGRAAGPLLRISSSGGEVAEATRLQSHQLSHRSPQFLPDGQHFIYYATGPSDVSGVYLGHIGHLEEARRLLDGTSAAIYASGHLLFERQGTLYAQPFDLSHFTTFGTAETVATNLGARGSVSVCSASNTGVIAYRAGAAQGRRQMQWVDRAGTVLTTLGDPMGVSSLALSPDGRRVALSRFDGGNPDIWVVDTDIARQVRLTSEPVIDIAPVWSPDATRIVFQSHQTEPGALYEVSASGGSTPKALLTGPRGMFPTDWSGDGETILFQTFDSSTRWDISALRLSGDRKAVPLLQTPFDERDAKFAPNSRWIAYSSDESGRSEIYVQQIAGTGTKAPISTTGGVQPVWKHDGTELYYLGFDGRLMAVPIQFTADSGIHAAAPVPLFMTHIGPSSPLIRQNYAVSQDGERFLMNTMIEDTRAAPITVILNWNPKT